MPLNDLICRNAKPKTKIYKLYDARGLYLEVMPSGSKYWRYKYRIDGTEKRLSLGIYPTVSLLEARTNHEQARLERKQGHDPLFLRQLRKQEQDRETGQTFEILTREWHKTHLYKWKSKYGREILQRFEVNLFREIGDVPIRALSISTLYECLKKIEKRAPHVAKRLKQKCGEVFRFAVQTGRADRDITSDLQGAFSVKRVKHRASIDIDELPEFLTALEKGKETLPLVTYLAMKIMLKTFQRRSELMKATWYEIDFDRAMWTIPGSRMKMGNEHLVPLSRQALADLKTLHQLTGNRRHLFPGLIKPNKPITLSIIMDGLEHIGYKGKMCTHGFRALAMGICKERLNYRHEIPDRQLAHVPQNEITRAYDRAKYLPQRIEMMQKYADYLDNQTQPHPTQRTAAHDRETTATIPQSYPGVTTSYRIQQSYGSAGFSGYK